MDAEAQKVEPIKYLSRNDASIVRQKKTEVIEREIDALVTEHKRVSSSMLVEVAQPATHPLHKYFEWDDSVAGKKYRLAQATAMILATRMVAVLNEKDGTVTAISPDEAKKVQLRKLLPAHDGNKGFQMRQEVLAHPDARKAIIDRKLSALRSWCKSVVDISELDSVRVAIEEHL